MSVIITNNDVDCYNLDTVRPIFTWDSSPGLPPHLRLRQTPSSENFKEFLTYQKFFYDDMVFEPLCKEQKPFLGYAADMSGEWNYLCNQIYHTLTHEEAILLIDYKTIFNDLIRSETPPPQIPNFFPLDLTQPLFPGWFVFDVLLIHHMAWTQVFKVWRKQPIEWIFEKLNSYLEKPMIPNEEFYREIILSNDRFIPKKFISDFFDLTLNTKGQKFFIPYLAKALDIWFPEPLIFILLNYLEKNIKRKKLFVDGFDCKSFQKQFLKLSSPEQRYRLFTREAIVYFDFSQHWIKLAQDYTKQFEKLFLKFPPLPIPLTVYRGVDQVDNFYTLNSWKGFTSTTLNPQIALGYIPPPKECCMLEITIPAGVRVLPILTMKTDGREILEILLPNDSKILWREVEEYQMTENRNNFTVKTFKILIINEL
jgi:hypothetical protein